MTGLLMVSYDRFVDGVIGYIYILMVSSDIYVDGVIRYIYIYIY